jgi:DtxR family Mn-dependent transcriptional regulator
MELSEKMEEILETLWIKTQEEGQKAVVRDEIETAIRQSAGDSTQEPLGALPEPLIDGQLLATMEEEGYVTSGANGFALSDGGRPLAENVVRRHRLAERLFADVLDAWNETNHAKACKFEHLLDRGLDDSICSLLGHPKVCPHGKPIPPGKCCQEMRSSSSRLVSPLSRLAEGQTGKVAYIAARKLDQLQKLTAMGILPGASISVVQTFPAYVFQAGQTQFAVDREIADAVYVRLSQAMDEPSAAPQPAKRRPAIRWLTRSG